MVSKWFQQFYPFLLGSLLGSLSLLLTYLRLSWEVHGILFNILLMWRNSKFDIFKIVFSTIEFAFAFWSCIYFISSSVVVSQPSYLTLNTCRNLIIYLYDQFHYFVIISHFNIVKMYFHFLFLLFLFPKLGELLGSPFFYNLWWVVTIMMLMIRIQIWDPFLRGKNL